MSPARGFRIGLNPVLGLTIQAMLYNLCEVYGKLLIP